MALSVVGGDFGDRRCLPPNPEDDVLCELNAEFRQSKSELIQRFLKDQEDLNHKFAEYELNCDEGEGTNVPGCQSGHHVEAHGHHVLPGDLPGGKDSRQMYDVLEDIEDKDLMDNLSITSAVNSSSDAPSLSDGGERASYEDLDEERDYDENWNVASEQSQHPPGSYDDQYYDQYSRDGPTLSRSVSTESAHSKHPLDIVPQPRKSKKNKEGTPTRKVKKLLVKKNVRPQTAMGVRALPDTDDILCANLSDSKTKPISAGSTTFTLHDSINMVGARFKKISWTGGTDQHPELGRLSISASVHKLHQRSHTPGGRLKSPSSPLMTAAALGSLRGGYEPQRGLSDAEVPSRSPSGQCQKMRNNTAPTELRELRPDPFRSGTPLSRPDSTMSNRSLISVDFGPEQLSGYGPRRTPNPQPIVHSSVYATDRSGRLVMSPSLTDGKGKKRPIAVLKLPPLDSSVVNRAIGAANLEPTGHQPSLVSPATAKSNTVATPSAI